MAKPKDQPPSTSSILSDQEHLSSAQPPARDEQAPLHAGKPAEPADYRATSRRAADEDQEPPSDPRRARPTLAEMEELVDQLRPAEMEQLLAILSKRIGRAGKTPTGRYVVVHGIRIASGGEKGSRLKPGTILEKGRLSAEEIEHFKAQGAIEPEFS
jgi:hypothetical protein